MEEKLMQQTPDWSQGDLYLRENAPELVPFLEKYGPCTLLPKDEAQHFEVLLTGIAAQQLPPDTSLEIMDRLKTLTGEPVTPENLLKLTDETLASCGLTALKVTYMKEFARAILDGSVDLAAWESLPDSQLLKKLKAVRGLGQWTIEMFMLLCLCRPDILPGDDFLLKKQVRDLYGLAEIPKRGELIRRLEHWRPWRSLAVWYLWQEAAAQEKE
jgi:DNA-3-methyladenine glycosylase II